MLGTLEADLGNLWSEGEDLGRAAAQRELFVQPLWTSTDPDAGANPDGCYRS